MITCKIKESETHKILTSDEYSYTFNKINGYFCRIGKDESTDPEYSPFGPEIADIEISTICSGINNTPCKFCYKSNTCKGDNMSFDTFKKVFHNLPRTLTQIAFGIGDIDANSDMWKIFDYCKNNDYNYVVPNVTINGDRLTPEILDRLSTTCGAVAVSRYNPPDVCYNAVKELTDRGMSQVNIHMLLSKETYEDCIKLIDDASSDPRLEKLNAIVFLALKPKGRGKNLKPLNNPDKYRELIYHAFDKKVGIGFDSCSAPLFLKAVEKDKELSRYEQLAEPCESLLFSMYINHKGTLYPCSFLEENSAGIDLTKEGLSLTDYWYASSTVEWRAILLNSAKCDTALVKGCRQCPAFDIY